MDRWMDVIEFWITDTKISLSQSTLFTWIRSGSVIADIKLLLKDLACELEFIVF